MGICCHPVPISSVQGVHVICMCNLPALALAGGIISHVRSIYHGTMPLMQPNYQEILMMSMDFTQIQQHGFCSTFELNRAYCNLKILMENTFFRWKVKTRVKCEEGSNFMAHATQHPMANDKNSSMLYMKPSTTEDQSHY